MKVRILASKEVPADDYVYRGDVVVGNTDNDRILIFSRRLKDAALYEHVALKDVPPNIGDEIKEALKSWRARLPDKTRHAKEFISLLFAPGTSSAEEERFAKAMEIELTVRGHGTRDRRDPRDFTNVYA